MRGRKAIKYICIDIGMIILLLLLGVSDTLIEALQLVIITDIGIGMIYLIKNVIRKIKK